MSDYRGDINLGDTLYIYFTTVGTTGAPTQLAGTPVVSVYEDNSTTEITAGVTLTVDFDGRTGMNLVTIVASSGNGFGSGQEYNVAITTGTVGGTSVVGYIVASFSIENRSALRPTTADRTLDLTTTGLAGVDFGNVEGTLPKTTVITGFNDLSAAQVNAEVDTALDTAIPGVNTADSVNDVLLDRVKPNLDVVVSTRATPAQVNTEVVDALNVDTYAEPAQGTPAATATLAAKLNYLFKAWRNRVTQTASQYSLYNDDAATVDHKATLSDDGTTADKGEVATGP